MKASTIRMHDYFASISKAEILSYRRNLIEHRKFLNKLRGTADIDEQIAEIDLFLQTNPHHP